MHYLHCQYNSTKVKRLCIRTVKAVWDETDKLHLHIYVGIVNLNISNAYKTSPVGTTLWMEAQFTLMIVLKLCLSLL